MRRLNLGFFGFGCVGQGLWDVLADSKGIQAEVVRIAVKNRDKPRRLPSRYFTYEKSDILNSPDIDLVVEMINDVDEAHDIVTTALKNGKDVVSANKKLLAEHFEELVELQQETGRSLLYEAAACGSIPIIRTLEEYYDSELLYSVKGIFNGTSNYVLTRVCSEGLSYSRSLQQAIDKGFAEEDPSSDVDGFDAKYKLVIIAAHSFGVFLSPREIYNHSIAGLEEHEIQYAKEKGYQIKQVAQVRKLQGDKLAIYVLPRFVGKDSSLHSVDYEYNGVIVRAAFTDEQFYRGKGAGGHPTGSAVLSDISACRYDYKYEYKKAALNNGLSITQDVPIRVYFRYMQKDQLQLSRFIRIDERYESGVYNYAVGAVNLAELQKDDYFRQDGVYLVEMPDSEFEVREV